VGVLVPRHQSNRTVGEASGAGSLTEFHSRCLMDPPDHVARPFIGFAENEPRVLDRLVAALYKELQRLAQQELRHFRPADRLDTTDLVHETYLRLADQPLVCWRDCNHFLAAAARAMRHIMIDYTRYVTAAKRGGTQAPISLDATALAVGRDPESALTLDEVIERLNKLAPRLVQVVECRVFTGLSECETSGALGISVRTVRRDWMRARAWLRVALSAGPAPTGNRVASVHRSTARLSHRFRR
jgi:RNA polymerase sigma-70 factor, ECF subfamily